ncbi:hypothetical protein WDA79_07525 [Streptomyces sp. A475]|uniref:hypothetical protein n=1 Tax=unclassified Streptomyces TaxID=2593676 RepID=UPI0030C9E6D6
MREAGAVQASLPRYGLAGTPDLGSGAVETHHCLDAAVPLRALPETITDLGEITRLRVRPHDRPGGPIHEHRHAA